MSVTTASNAPTGTYAGGIGDYANTGWPSVTQALSLRADYLRSDVDILGGEVQELQGELRELDISTRTLEKGKKDVPALLHELAYDRGMAWADIAELTQVSVSAIRKWRKGADASAESRGRLARIAALLDVLEEKGLVRDPARWMEMDLPLGPGFFLRPMDLYIDGHVAGLLDIAEQRRPLPQVLDELMPGWRDARTNFEVQTDTDGQRSIRLRRE